MRVITTIGSAKSERTLADLDSGVLASVHFIDTKTVLLRWRNDMDVLGPQHARSGPIIRHGDAPERYTVMEVHGPLTFSFED